MAEQMTPSDQVRRSLAERLAAGDAATPESRGADTEPADPTASPAASEIEAPANPANPSSEAPWRQSQGRPWRRFRRSRNGPAARPGATAGQPRSRFVRGRTLVTGGLCGAVLMGMVWIAVDGFGQNPAALVAPDPDAGPRVAAAELPESVADYAELYAAVRALQDHALDVQRGNASADYSGREVAPMSADTMSSSADGYTATNAQVSGIDEGDIVKTDGNSIFVAAGAEVQVVEALGENTRQVARIDTVADLAASRPADDRAYYVPGSVLDLMVHESTLVVVVHEYIPRADPIPGTGSMTYIPVDAQETKALLYDVSNPSTPRLSAVVGQSGAFVSSRLQGSILYLVSDYPLLEPETATLDDPLTFAPRVSGPDGILPLAPGDITIAPSAIGPRYSVVSSVDLDSGQRLDQQAVLGGSETVYMSPDHLYLAAVNYGLRGAWIGEPGVVEDSAEAAITTQVVRIELTAGALTVGATASLPGSLLNQFALDEYDGHLRAVTTVMSEANGWIEEAALWTLGPDLAVQGSIPTLVAGESVQSVRFDGAVGYVVTFKRVDPLFAIDLSDPARPTVMSELKIPGFSTYLHPWAEGHLLGLGMNGDEKGFVNGLKLSMFGTADPFAVTELSHLEIDFDETEGLYNHKAILVDTDLALIGFPGIDYGQDGSITRRYLISGYDVEQGFLPLRELVVTPPARPYDSPSTRGLRIGDFLYVCTAEAVDVFALGSFDQVATVTP
jgi:uncharacterized secreted protein with C-terminal beta-propeller domain